MKKSIMAPNFTTAEIMHFLKLVEKYKIIENKRTDGATTKDKQAAWKNLAAEYNSQTNFSPRTADKLMSCYKNQKVKVKKMHSCEKMAIKAPLLLNAVEEHGQDWDRVAQATEASGLDCQNTFAQLVKEAKKEELLYKKEICRTGGGPPPQQTCSRDPVIEQVKALIGPSLDGLYTIYDGDADFMKEQQSLANVHTHLEPIEKVSNFEERSTQIENGTSNQDLDRSRITHKSDHKRLTVMKRKVDPSLESFKKRKKKLGVSTSFQKLADDKKGLVKAQKTLVDYEIQHQQLLIELAQEKLQFERKKKQMESDFISQKYKLELESLTRRE